MGLLSGKFAIKSMADGRIELFQENDMRKDEDPVPDKDHKGVRIDAKKAEQFKKYLVFQ